MFSLYYPSLCSEVGNIKAAKTIAERNAAIDRLVDLWTEAGTYTINQLSDLEVLNELDDYSPEWYIRNYRNHIYLDKTLSNILENQKSLFER